MEICSALRGRTADRLSFLLQLQPARLLIEIMPHIQQQQKEPWLPAPERRLRLNRPNSRRIRIVCPDAKLRTGERIRRMRHVSILPRPPHRSENIEAKFLY